jgi:hypothetical protein
VEEFSQGEDTEEEVLAGIGRSARLGKVTRGKRRGTFSVPDLMLGIVDRLVGSLLFLAEHVAPP